MNSTVPPDRLRRLFADVFEIPIGQVEPMSSPDTVASWDSLHHLNLVLALEQEFQVQIDPEEIVQLLSFELIEMILAEKLGKNGTHA